MSGEVILPSALLRVWRTRILVCVLLPLSPMLCIGRQLHAQLPFYTDDTAVTEPGKVHLEFFNEYDGLQLQDPNRTQNTANFKVNYGLPFSFEADVDFPYLAINRTEGNTPSHGFGDTNLGIKKNLRNEAADSRAPALAASFYIEFPTGDPSQQLGSGLHDYWLNFMAQKSLSSTIRITANAGYLFAGNTNTGALGTATRGHVFPGGISLQRDFLPSLTLGAEVFGAYAANADLAKSQLQAMAGGRYVIRKGFSFSFGLLGGKYVASPRFGGQIGFAMDFPQSFDSSAH